MTHRRIIIGDVHGHYQALLSLLEAIAPTKEDKIYFLGDLIDRGPESSQVVEFVKENKYPCLLGNHELMLLGVLSNQKSSGDLFQSWLVNGGYSTVVSYNYKIPQEHIDWFSSLPHYLDLEDVWLVHAGLSPDLAVQDQSPHQFCWIRDDFHSMTVPYFPDKLIITGHTITFTFPGVEPGKIAAGAGWLDIDTGAYHPHSGWLTGLDITNQIVYQVNTQNEERRSLPLEEAITFIDPTLVRTKRLKIKQES